MPVLITCEHLLNDNFFNSNNELSFLHYLNGEEKTEKLDLNENRKVYRNKDLDVVIVVIKEKDNLDIFDFLNIDDSINIKNPQIKNKKVFLLHYPKSLKDVYISQGTIYDLSNDEIINDKYQCNSFFVDYSSFKGSSGSPVFNYENNYVIGLHNRKDENSEIREAILIKRVINQFNEYIKPIIFDYKSPYSYLNTIDIIYSLPSDGNIIKLFGTEFVNRYKKKLNIIYNGKKYPISEYFYINKNDLLNKDFRIKLIGVKRIKDASYMFRFVNNLLDVPNISRMDAKNIKSMEVMFEGCEELKELRGINRWNVENVVSMRGMFYDCKNLKYLPEIEEWKSNNLQNCYQMFYGCESLPNSEASKIEKWKNINPNIRKEAFNGYSYGYKTNYYVHGFFECIRMINNFFGEKK